MTGKVNLLHCVQKVKNRHPVPGTSQLRLMFPGYVEKKQNRYIYDSEKIFCHQWQ